MSKRVLFASSEVYPFAKSGGLADVAFGLPHALAADVIMPLYRSIDRARYGIATTGMRFEIALGKTVHVCELFSTQYEGMRCYFIYTPILCDKKALYGTPTRGYADNDLRFGIFCYAVCAFLEQTHYDILHLNDWQTALCALLVAQSTLQTKTIFTIHNLAYQGVFSQATLKRLQISRTQFHMEALEFYGDVSFIKAGIAYAHALTTVSPTYAQEILKPEFGCGLEGFLARHKVAGILNGINAAHFNPKTDTLIEAPFDQAIHKAPNKKALLHHYGIQEDTWPLFIFIGRLTWQKGVDTLLQALDTLAGLPLHVIIIGEGEPQYQKALEDASKKSRTIHFHYGYDEALSHRLYAAADFLLMPSRFEPCGLNQMIAMRYAGIPIVTPVGGLKDSVHPIGSSDLGQGFIMHAHTAEALLSSIQEALELYENKSAYKRVCTHNMGVDYSWEHSAAAYRALYEKVWQ